MSNINDTLKRINELAAKKKSGQELMPEELAEKKELYEIYLSFIRGQINIKSHLIRVSSGFLYKFYLSIIICQDVS